MPTIDELQINISATATSASNAIDKLAQKLGVLSSALGSIEGGKFNELTNGLNRLGTSLQSVSNIQTQSLTRMVNAIKNITNIDAGKLNTISSGVNTLSVSLTAISSIGSFQNAAGIINTLKNFAKIDMSRFDSSKLRDIAQAISMLSSVPDLSHINSTINAIKNLVRVDMSGFDTAKLQAIASTLSSFATQMSSVGAIEGSVTKLVTAMARLASSGQYISNVNTYFPQLGNAVVALVGKLSTANAIDASISKLVEAIAKLANAGKKIQVTVANLNQLGDGIENLINRLNRLPQINANLAAFIQGLGNIAASGNSAGVAGNNLARVLNIFSTSSDRATKKTLSLAAALGKLYASYWVLFRAFRWIGKAMDISSDLTEVQNVVDVTFGEMSYKVEEFAQNSIQQFGLSELSLKQFASRFQAMGSAMGINSRLIGNANRYLNEQTQGYIELSDSMSDVSLNLTKLAADMASFYNVEQKAVAEDLESIFTGATRPLNIAA